MVCQNVDSLPCLLTELKLLKKPGKLVGRVGEVEHHEEVHPNTKVVVDGDDPEFWLHQGRIEPIPSKSLLLLRVKVVSPLVAGKTLIEPGIMSRSVSSVDQVVDLSFLSLCDLLHHGSKC